jgi:peptidoglycan/LPS O-acetylase OafA/YrhL
LFVASVVFLVSGAPPSFKTDWLSVASFTVNLARLRPQDVGPWCVHIWSLGIEQQFYLVWPFLVFFLSQRGFKLTVAAIIALTPLIRLWIFQYLLHTGHDSLYAGKAVYVLPVTQLDAFAAGAAIPTWALQGIPHAKRWFLGVLTITAAAGVAVLAFAYFGHRGVFLSSLGYAMFLPEDYEYVWGYSLINLLSMLGIVCAIQGLAPRHLIENRLIVWIGAISYGFYVYHIPMLLIGEQAMELFSTALRQELRPVFFIVWIMGVIGISYASYAWLERPVLRLKDYWQNR